MRNLRHWVNAAQPRGRGDYWGLHRASPGGDAHEMLVPRRLQDSLRMHQTHYYRLIQTGVGRGYVLFHPWSSDRLGGTSKVFQSNLRRLQRGLLPPAYTGIPGQSLNQIFSSAFVRGCSRVQPPLVFCHHLSSLRSLPAGFLSSAGSPPQAFCHLRGSTGLPPRRSSVIRFHPRGGSVVLLPSAKETPSRPSVIICHPRGIARDPEGLLPSPREATASLLTSTATPKGRVRPIPVTV